jgi:hypothetical protein
MKKILITGMNTAQCNKDYFLRQELQVVASHYALIRCLEDMGYAVEQRPVELGEDLSGYDDVVIYMHSIQAFCQYLYSGMYAIAARPDAILAFDDWQMDQIYNSFAGFIVSIKDKKNAYREYLLDQYQGKEDAATIESYEQHYLDACNLVLEKKNRLLISAFDGGDLSLLELGWNGPVFRFNPNPYHLNRTPENNYGEPGSIFSFSDNEVQYADKLRAWNFSSLVQKKTRKWLDKQNSKDWNWPIHFYGARRGEEVKQQRLTESEMCRVYNAQWGCLMPGYFHSGSGWWRARPLQVADAGSILICDEREGSVYGEAYVGLTADKVEGMDLDQLIKTACMQRDCLYEKHPLDKSVTRAELSAILEAK